MGSEHMEIIASFNDRCYECRECVYTHLVVDSGAIDTIIDLGYFLSYSFAIACVALPLVYSGFRHIPRVRTTARFLGALSLAGITVSLQVVLDALRITDDLPQPWPDALTVIFNSVIVVALTAVSFSWSSLIRAILPRRSRLDPIRRPTEWVVIVLTVANIVFQLLTEVSGEPWSITAAGIGVSAQLTVIAFVFALDLIRLYRPFPNRRRELLPVRIVPVLFLAFGLSILYLQAPWDRLAAPVFLILSSSVGLWTVLSQVRIARDPEATREALFDEAGLSPRERQIAVMLAEGRSYKEIGAALFVSLSTVQTHVTRIYAKLEVGSKTELSNRLGSR